MTTLSAPSHDAVSASSPLNRRAFRRPLSTHGMPKEPRTLSPARPHRFSAFNLPSPTFSTTNSSPQSPSPMSPPMSAKSFGTFIDSEPSTPACSPRMEHDWDSSTIVLLRPASSSSEPTSPTEPAWDMMVPLKVPPRTTVLTARSRAPAFYTKDISATTSLSSHPTKQVRAAKQQHESRVLDLPQKENLAPREVDLNDAKDQTTEESITNTGAAPLGKLASKMKLMLRRKDTNSKKRHKKEREYHDLDRMEDVHWTEM